MEQENAGWKKIKEDAGKDWRYDFSEKEARREYISMFHETTGIKLNYDNIPEETNQGMYYVAKLFCNSLWIRYGMKDTFTNTKTVYDRNTFCDIVFNDKYERNFTFISENAINVSSKRIEEILCTPTETNVAIAGYTTAYDELEEGTFITEFVSTGPKSYAYKTNNGKI